MRCPELTAEICTQPISNLFTVIMIDHGMAQHFTFAEFFSAEDIGPMCHLQCKPILFTDFQNADMLDYTPAINIAIG